MISLQPFRPGPVRPPKKLMILGAGRSAQFTFHQVPRPEQPLVVAILKFLQWQVVVLSQSRHWRNDKARQHRRIGLLRILEAHRGGNRGPFA